MSIRSYAIWLGNVEILVEGAIISSISSVPWLSSSPKHISWSSLDDHPTWLSALEYLLEPLTPFFALYDVYGTILISRDGSVQKMFVLTARCQWRVRWWEATWRRHFLFFLLSREAPRLQTFRKSMIESDWESFYDPSLFFSPIQGWLIRSSSNSWAFRCGTCHWHKAIICELANHFRALDLPMTPSPYTSQMPGLMGIPFLRIKTNKRWHNSKCN